MIAPLTTGEIYWGAIPFVILQLVMVVAIIVLPGLVMRGGTAPGAPETPSQQQRIEDLDKTFGPAGLPQR
jgi:hypothetical protein